MKLVSLILSLLFLFAVGCSEEEVIEPDAAMSDAILTDFVAPEVSVDVWLQQDDLEVAEDAEVILNDLEVIEEDSQSNP